MATMLQLLSYEQFYKEITDKKLPIKLAYKLNKIMELVITETNFYRKKLDGIINEYAIKDENGNLKYTDDGTRVMIEPTKINECNNEINSLNELEVEFDLGSNYLNLDELETLECTVSQISALMTFIK